MMTSVRKTLKTLVWSAQNWSIFSEICPENSHKIRRFFTDSFLAKFALKIPAKSADFSVILSLKIPRNFTFFPWPIRSPETCLVSVIRRKKNLRAKTLKFKTNELWNRETHKMDQNPPITNHMTFITHWSKLLFPKRSAKICLNQENCLNQAEQKLNLFQQCMQWISTEQT